MTTTAPLTASSSEAGARWASASAGGRPRRRRTDWHKILEIALLAGPAILVFLAFVILPVLMAAYYGFFKWKGFGRRRTSSGSATT